MAISRRGPRASGRNAGQTSGRRPAASQESSSRRGVPSASRKGPAVSGSQKSSTGSRVGPAVNKPGPVSASRTPAVPAAGAKPALQRPGGSVPSARSAQPAQNAANPATPVKVAGPAGPRVSNTVAPAQRAKLPSAASVPTAATRTNSPRASGASNTPNANPASRKTGTPPTGSPRISEQLRSLPQEERELPDIPMLPPRDDSKVSKNWTSNPPAKGRITTRHVKTGTAILTLESEDAIVIETDDDSLVQKSDNTIKALQSDNSIKALPKNAGVSGKTSKSSKAAPGDGRVTGTAPATETKAVTVANPAAEEPQEIPVKKSAGGKSSRISASVAAKEKVVEADPEPVPVAAKKSKSSKLTKAVEAEPAAEPEALAVADAKKGKGSKVSKAVPAEPAASKRIAAVKAAAEAAEDAAADNDDLEPDGDADEAGADEAAEADAGDDDDDEDGEKAAAGSKPSARGSRASARKGGAETTRGSARASSRGSARGSRRMAAPPDPAKQKKMILMAVGGAIAVIGLIVAIWYITGPLKTKNLIAAIQGADASAAKQAIPELADHLGPDAVSTYSNLAGDIKDEARLEMLSEGLAKTARSNPRPTQELCHGWLTSPHLGLQKAAAITLTKFVADEASVASLMTIVKNTSTDANLRVSAASALGFSKNGKAAPALGDCVYAKEENGQVRAAADTALWDIRESASSKDFADLLRKYPETATRKTLLQKFIFDEAARNDDAALDCYKVGLSDPDKDLRLLVVQKLIKRFPGEKIAAPLLPYLTDKEPAIGVEVAKFLGTVSGSGRPAALETVLKGIANTELDASVRKQLTISLGYLAEYKDATALKLLIDTITAEQDPAAQANLRGALAQVCTHSGQQPSSQRTKLSKDEWIAWYAKFTAFKLHQKTATDAIMVVWGEYNKASGHMATDEMVKEAQKLSETIQDLGDKECDPEDQLAYEQETGELMKHCDAITHQGVVNLYPGH